MTSKPVVRSLPLPEGFDPKTQHCAGLFLQQLDDQTRRLKESIAGYGAEQLAWQPSPGQNTTGMLLAHMALAETYWMLVSSGEFRMEPGEETAEALWERMWPRLKEIVGLPWDGDGMPQKPDGGHPDSLAGKPLDFYWETIARARAFTRERLLAWRDDRLADSYRVGDRTISLGWTIYHVLEHFCGHFGQILMLRHLMRDAGAWTGELE